MVAERFWSTFVLRNRLGGCVDYRVPCWLYVEQSGKKRIQEMLLESMLI